MTYSETPEPVVPVTRPTGVTLAALALGFASLGLLLLAGLTLFSGYMIRQAPPTDATATPGAPSMQMIAVFTMVFALCQAAVALWGGVTVAGLLRLKQWARISIIILGGIVAAGGLLFTVSCLVTPMMMKSTPLPPQVNMAQLRLVFAAFAAVSLAVALVGIWWIVYFLLARTRAAFDGPKRTHTPVIARSSANTAPSPGLITDFTVAQHLPPSEVTPAEDPGRDL